MNLVFLVSSTRSATSVMLTIERTGIGAGPSALSIDVSIDRVTKSWHIVVDAPLPGPPTTESACTMIVEVQQGSIGCLEATTCTNVGGTLSGGSEAPGVTTRQVTAGRKLDVFLHHM